MKRSGRILLPLIVVACLVAIALVIVLARGESPQIAAREFLNALGTGDVPELVKRSYMEGLSEQEVRQKWEATVKEKSPYYRWTYRLRSDVQPTEDTATVKIDMIRNPLKGSASPEGFQLPMVKEGERWKVDVRGLNREMYPWLPR